MADRRDLFDLIGNLDGCLGRLEDDLSQVTLATPRAKACQMHVRASRDWIRTVLRGKPDYAEMTMDRSALKSLENALVIVQECKPGSEGDFAVTGNAIDEALTRTYAAIQDYRGPRWSGIGEPVTYDKTLSFLPGDPDFPTDTDPERHKSSKSFLPDDVDYQSKTTSGRNRRSEDFDR